MRMSIQLKNPQNIFYIQDLQNNFHEVENLQEAQIQNIPDELFEWV